MMAGAFVADSAITERRALGTASDDSDVLHENARTYATDFTDHNDYQSHDPCCGRLSAIPQSDPRSSAQIRG